VDRTDETGIVTIPGPLNLIKPALPELGQSFGRF